MEYKLAKDRMVSRNKVKRKRYVSTIHYHEEYELYYMMDGSTTYFIGNEFYGIEKGNFVFIPRGIPHNTDSQNCHNNERFLLSFSEDIFDKRTRPLLEQLMNHRVLYVPETHLPQLEEIMFKLEAEYAQSDQSLLLDIYILELLALLLRYRCDKKAQIQESDKIVYTISDYIRNHFEQDISLEELCRRFAISEGYLSRKFKAVSGIGLNQFITYVRISNAEKLLAETDLSVTEIAKRCGFNGSNYFTSVFKKIKGMTPLMYKKYILTRR